MMKMYRCVTCWALLLITVGCSTIDDDLTDCPPATGNSQLDYELRLVTNMTTELHTELTTQTDISVASALRTYLADIFTDYAHDVDLSFYDTEGDSVLLVNRPERMDANQKSYTLNVPMRRYMHLAVANVVDNEAVHLRLIDRCHTSQLWQEGIDTVASHTTGVFTARQPMEVIGGVDQHFDVHLYMANCAASLVVDTLDSGIRSLRVFTTGFASAYNVADSSYVFSGRSPIVRTNEIHTEGTDAMTFCSVNFPSRDVRGNTGAAPLWGGPTRTVIETPDPFVAPTADESLWELHVYADLKDGTTTESKFYVNTPLRAGQLRVIKARAYTDGSVRTADPTVSVSVTTKWNDGGTYNPEL